MSAATGAIGPNTGSALYINPIRAAYTGTTYSSDITNTVYYNPSSYELTYATRQKTSILSTGQSVSVSYMTISIDYSSPNLTVSATQVSGATLTTNGNIQLYTTTTVSALGAVAGSLPNNTLTALSSGIADAANNVITIPFTDGAYLWTLTIITISAGTTWSVSLAQT